MIQKLIDYGLSEKEAKIYVNCLKLGQATANRISELSNVPRSTTYDILDKIKTFGLVSTCIIDNKTNFIVNDPSILITAIKEKESIINAVLPDLKKIYKKIEDKPQAEVFQGKVAILKLFDEILDSAKELRVLGSMGNALEKIGYHPEKFRLKRLSKKIKIKQLLEDSEDSRKVKVDKYTKVRFVSSLKNSKEGTFIFDDYVYHILFQYEISAIKIKSIDHAKAMGIMFEELWKASKS